jgi:hypothetical protein
MTRILNISTHYGETDDNQKAKTKVGEIGSWKNISTYYRKKNDSVFSEKALKELRNVFRDSEIQH